MIIVLAKPEIYSLRDWFAYIIQFWLVEDCVTVSVEAITGCYCNTKGRNGKEPNPAVQSYLSPN